MANCGFFLDAPGPLNFKAPWLTFSSGKPTLSRLPPRRNSNPSPRNEDPSGATNGNLGRPPPRKRQRAEHYNQPHVISLLDSDDEHDSDPPASRIIREDRHQKQTIPRRVSARDIREGMAAAKRLSAAAIRPSPLKEEKRPPFSGGEAMRPPPGIRRFGGHVNSLEIKNKKLLVEMGILDSNSSSKRVGLSDPNALTSLTYEIVEQIIPDPTSAEGLNPSAPPSSFIPLDVD
ncbi:hypothetical protein F4677DRAFT_445437 [Hypoxylon crocopeplum]|nr:hypothetical protein F4677DRAFT_445437 [Hypoxylon crocopeplum]